ncbi:hypothetical protein KR018_001181 [Drosophila ironensis]|nr:hypothetical protein KR018_001181 [Drosophila ironensis]
MTVTDDQGRDQRISGTYLVAYSNRIGLNGTWFVNQLGDSMRKPAVSAMTAVNITTHQKRLSLPFLHELSLSNLYHIGTLREELSFSSFLSYSLALLGFLLLCSTIWLSYHHLKNRAHVNPGTNEELSGHRDGDHLKGGEVNTSMPRNPKLPSCKPYPVANTRSPESADSAHQVQSHGVRSGHLRN